MGVSIKIEGKLEIFRGRIGPFTTDNLGAHMIGCYPESFNGLRICRFCMATKTEKDCKVHVSIHCLTVLYHSYLMYKRLLKFWN